MTSRAPGGSSSAQVDAALATPFNPETVWNYEVGEKFTGFDNRFTFDADVFEDQYLHLQTSQLVIINSVPIPITSDAGNARVAGIEVESTALPTNWLTLGLTYAAMDTKFLSHKTGFYGARIPYAPKQQVHASAEVHFPVSSARRDYRGRWRLYLPQQGFLRQRQHRAAVLAEQERLASHHRCLCQLHLAG